MIIKKQCIYATIGILLAFAIGAFVGVKYLSPELTQHHYTETKTNTIVQPTIIQGETKTDT